LKDQVRHLNKMIEKEMFNKDGSRKDETKYKPLRNNHGKSALGYNSCNVNPSVENKGTRLDISQVCREHKLV